MLNLVAKQCTIQLMGSIIIILLLLYRRAGLFRGGNINFAILQPPMKNKILAACYASMQLVQHSAKVFSMKCSLPTDPQRFSPLKVYHYTVKIVNYKLDSIWNWMLRRSL